MTTNMPLAVIYESSDVKRTRLRFFGILEMHIVCALKGGMQKVRW